MDPLTDVELVQLEYMSDHDSSLCETARAQIRKAVAEIRDLRERCGIKGVRARMEYVDSKS